MKKILVPTDFSAASDTAIEAAILLSKSGGLSITLLHIRNSDSKDLIEAVGKTQDELESHLESICSKLKFDHEVDCSAKIIEGSIFDDINAEGEMPDYVFMVIGTHGTRGLRQALFGADLMRIAKKSSIPVLAVPETCVLDGPNNKIVFPFGTHSKFFNKTEATAMFADLLNAEIKIYSVLKGQMGSSESSLKNLTEAREYFKSEGLATELVQESVEGYSIGFAGQTLDFAKREGAKIISVMSTPSQELSIISASDKEALINNEEGIAILLTSDY